MPSKRTLLLVGIAAVALVVGALAGRIGGGGPTLRAVTLLPEPRALPELTLKSGAADLRIADLTGRWTVVFLGYTRCPDVCPTTLALVASADHALADLPEARRPRLLFVSVDPARDPPDRALAYARFYDPAFLGATADPAVLARLAGALGAPIALGPADAHGDYEVDHPGALFLLDPQARFAAVLTPPLDAAALADDLRALGGG